ncbi:hypothetical protein CNMCM8980_002002 [Aspergillus fumigatiaffinis]|uniref:Xylanolytic transcriptional activator regulatory domain-containing protein n=1 Tax=Aspergillus fumigatiaffinis TaxID=340414 RepID=A0A8H4GT85_9EURO|nr:hypothetical protein CNMCM5878_002575 [Aspergillus fumigatiaffinis]KAF4221649.1 hypothetical protein CNMCM6457_001800 [Aspergillus fumigatiaffinis]KAF4228076.1 hypothetical protein CNMCM6805_002462 [Aspergillus fumigatiaffinis]KAF4250143.1 hypothetical protein CNMCM8980_002002 [Aspergillus fumigatiaffinis]
MFTSYNADQTHHLEQTCTYVDSQAPSSPCRQLHLDDSGTSVSGLGGLPTPSSSASVPSPEAADLKLTKSGTGFKDSTHWTSVLSGVTEAPEGAIPSETAVDDGSSPLEQNVLLFDGCKHATDQELLDAMPSRRESDSLVALYFRAQEYRSVIHPTEFLKRVSPHIPLEKANHRPRESSITHSGRTLSLHPCPGLVSCTASSAQQPSSEQTEPNQRAVVQCLVRAQFAKGGPDIMETLVHYLLIESYLNGDSNVEVWLLMGNIVQIAIRMGYHRDPQHFKSLSPYQGEMRRRMWAMIYSLDIGFSTQMGLPSSIKHSLSDTMPPRNLQDRDFDANSIELPPERPIDELTSSTVILTKLHVATSIGVVSDLVCSPHQLSYEDLVEANAKLDLTYATIPGPCKFRPMSGSLLDPPSVVFQRINFYMHYQRARILVNWKFLGTSQDTSASNKPWSIVIDAALEILRLQHRLAEESDVLDASRLTASQGQAVGSGSVRSAKPAGKEPRNLEQHKRLVEGSEQSRRSSEDRTWKTGVQYN